MERKLTKRQQLIYQALRDLGQPSTMQEVGKRAGLSVNGVSQTLSALDDIFEFAGMTTDKARTGRRKDESLWRIKN